MPALVAGIHVFHASTLSQGVDRGNKSGHDERRAILSRTLGMTEERISLNDLDS
jgi:hypothetical protein